MLAPEAVAASLEVTAPPGTAGFLALGTVAAGVLNYLFSLLLTHGLTADQFTVFAGAQALLVIVGVIGSAGIPWVVAAEIGASGGDLIRRERAIQFGFWASLLFGAVAAVTVFAVTAAFASLSNAALVGGTTLVLSVGSTGMGVLQGDGRTARMATIFIGEVALKIASGMLAVFVFHAGSAGALVGLLLGATVLLASLPSLQGGVGSPMGAVGSRDLWLATRYIGGLQVGIGVLGALDSLLVAGLGATRHRGAGWQVASTLGKAPLFVSGAVSTAVFPSLVRPGANQRRVEALRSYGTVTAFGVLVLVTVPSSVVAFVFPASYTTVSAWLPWTAALGAGLGLLNLFTTFVQAEASDTAAMRIVASTLVGELVAGCTLGLCFGLRGLAVGVVVPVWLGVISFTFLTSVGETAKSFLSGLRRWGSLVGCVGVVVETVAVVRWPLVWCISTAAIGVACLAQAFPELLMTRKSERNIIVQRR